MVFKIDDYTKNNRISGELTRSGSPLHEFPFTDSLLFDQQFETDSSPVYTAGLFRTSRGPDRAQLSTFNAEGEQLGGLYIYEDDKEVVGLYRGFLDFFDPTTGHSASIGMVGDDLQLISTDGNIVLDVQDGSFAIIVTQSILPATDGYGDLGSSSQQFHNIFIDGSLVAEDYLAGGIVAITDGVAAPSTIAGLGQIYIDTADGDLKIKFGDGTVKTIVTD